MPRIGHKRSIVRLRTPSTWGGSRQTTANDLSDSSVVSDIDTGMNDPEWPVNGDVGWGSPLRPECAASAELPDPVKRLTRALFERRDSDVAGDRSPVGRRGTRRVAATVGTSVIGRSPGGVPHWPVGTAPAGSSDACQSGFGDGV